jgi:hypothetical protein
MKIFVSTLAATGTISPPIFHLRSAPPQERQAKMQKPVLCGGLRADPNKKQWVAKDKISIYTV